MVSKLEKYRHSAPLLPAGFSDPGLLLCEPFCI